MKTLRFYQLDGEQKLDAISKMCLANGSDEKSLAIELEQGYDPDQDFYFIVKDDEVIVELREFA